MKWWEYFLLVVFVWLVMGGAFFYGTTEENWAAGDRIAWKKVELKSANSSTPSNKKQNKEKSTR
jgi:hypothetical protein